jgi:KaiC/GvpD/RAD55 family RecA-like ATPase
VQGAAVAPDVEVKAPSPSPATDEAGAAWARWRVQPAHGEPNGPWEKRDCPSCLSDGLSESLLVEPAGTRFYCTHCGFHGDAAMAPDRYVGQAPVGHITWPEPADDAPTLAQILVAEGFDPAAIALLVPDLCVKQAYFSPDTPHPGWQTAVMAPCREEAQGPIVDLWFVAVDADHRLQGSRRLPRGRAVPWGWDQLQGDAVFFVERLTDRLALLLAGQPQAVCLPPTLNPAIPGGGDWSSMPLMEARLATVNRVDLGFVNTDAGHRLEDELGRRMGRERCWRTRWLSHPLPDEATGSAAAVLAHYGVDGLREALGSLAPYPVAGIHELMDVDDQYENYYEMGFERGVLVGLPSLDLYYSVPMGQLTLVHGVPGHGKSTLVDEIVVRLAKRYNWSFGVMSPENQPVARHFASFTEKYVGKPFVETEGVERISRAEKEEAKRWLNEHIRMILPDDEHGNWSLDGVMELARTLVYRYGIRGLVIDPWNELDHARPMNQTYDEYLGAALTKLKRFARVWGVHVWVVAHPVKLEHKQDGFYPVPTPYTVNGGAMWFNKSDFILVPYRHRGDVDEEITDIYTQKVRQREHGRIGRTSLRYDVMRNRYIDDVDHQKRINSLQKRSPDPTDVQLGPERMDSPIVMTRATTHLLGVGRAKQA